MKKLQVGLLFGGCSGEHEVSIKSAIAIADALTKSENSSKYQLIPFYVQKDGIWQVGEIAQALLTSIEVSHLKGSSDDRSDNSASISGFSYLKQVIENPKYSEIDVWFPIIHGPNGEDGSLQGLLQLIGVPFVGSGVLGSALGMDKIAMKMVFDRVELPQVRYMGVKRSQIWSDPCVFSKLIDGVEANIGYPCFVKPANLGSSVGIAKVRTPKELETALDNAATLDRRIVIEAGVVARELECAVLGNDYPKASVVGEITYESDFYDYETKYSEGRSKCLIPAPIPDAVAAKIKDMSLEAFAAVDAAGLARVDFFYVEKTGEIFINEINTLPGFTATSMYAQLWKATGISFPELVDKLIELALERHQKPN